MWKHATALSGMCALCPLETTSSCILLHYLRTYVHHLIMQHISKYVRYFKLKVQPLCAAVSMATSAHVLHQAARSCVAWQAAGGSAHHH